jgi:hypothetical protein
VLTFESRSGKRLNPVRRMRLACLIRCENGNNALGEISSNGYDCYDFPFR